MGDWRRPSLRLSNQRAFITEHNLKKGITVKNHCFNTPYFITIWSYTANKYIERCKGFNIFVLSVRHLYTTFFH